jgi:hypothetical protein
VAADGGERHRLFVPGTEAALSLQGLDAPRGGFLEPLDQPQTQALAVTSTGNTVTPCRRASCTSCAGA